MATITNVATVGVRCSGNFPRGLIGKTKFNIAPLTAANIATQLANVTAVRTAMVNLTNGAISSQGVEYPQYASTSYPVAPANRGSKWIVTAQNVNGRVFTYTIAAANETAHLQSDQYTADLTNADWEAFTTAFDAVAVDPAGNVLTIIKAHLGGRRR